MVAAAIVGGAVVGGVASSRAADKGADAQRDASRESTALSREQYAQGLEEVRPFKELGLSSLSSLRGAIGQPVNQFQFRDSGKFLDSYYDSPEYGALNAQATDQILRNRSATGGLRSGGSQVDLAQIAPMLGIDALRRTNEQDLQAYGINQSAQNDQFNRLYGIASLGANVAGGNQVAGANFASTAGNNAIMAGQARANAYQQQGQAIGGLASDVASVYAGQQMGYFDRNNQGRI